MIVSGGTHTPGVPASAFAMEPGMAIRYDQPTAMLSAAVTGYTVYHAASPEPRTDWFLPAPAMICTTVDAGPITTQIAANIASPPPGPFLIGPSSAVQRTLTHGGAMVGIGLSAAGWARLTHRRASDLHNRVVPLSSMIDPALAQQLGDAITSTPNDAGLKPLLDSLLPGLLRRDHGDEAAIHALMAAIVTDGLIEVGDVSARLDIEPFTLRRLSLRYFGMPTKLLLRRARFLRSLLPMLSNPGSPDRGCIDSSYHDMSHFLRDSNAFIGTTPRRFLAHATPFLLASLRARAAVLGAATQALHGDAMRIAMPAAPCPFPTPAQQPAPAGASPA